MTKEVLYDKMLFMKVLRNNKKYILTIILTFFATLFIFLGFGGNSAIAEQNTPSISYQTVAPSGVNEVFDFGSQTPSDTLAFDRGYAIIRTDKTLWLSIDGKEFEQFTNVENPTQIKMLDQNTILLLANNSLNLINISDLSISKLLYPNSTDTINGDTFDVKGNYLVVRSGAAVYLFELEGSTVKQKIESQMLADLDVDSLTPICVDQTGRVFFVKGNSVYAHKDTTTHLVYTTHGEIKNMICQGDMLYFIEYLQNKQVVKKTTFTDNPQDTEFTHEHTDDDLGKLITPTSLCFNGENLLISDSGVGAVQEFAIENDTLVWTGFAIAKNKTAFNRITDSATDIERYCDNIGVLSSDRITIIKKDQNFNAYDKNCFINLFAEDFFDEKLPSAFALGKDSLLGIKDSTTLTFLSIEGQSQAQEITLEASFIHDVCYQSGFYYALTTLENQLVIYKIDQTDLTVSQYGEKLSPKTNPVFTIDVFGNVYVFDQAENIIKLSSDLNGNVFAIKSDGFYQIVDNQAVKIADCKGTPKAFATCFDKKEVYFLCEGSEFIYSTRSLNNTAIDQTYVTANYVLTDRDSNADGLKFYKVKEGANVYSVTVDQNDLFCFDKLTNPEECYILICEIPEINHLALVGQKGVVLVEKSTALTYDNLTTTVKKTAFISTAVHAYYFPIITQSDLYVLSDDGAKMRLEKGTEITTKNTFSFADRDFYYATFTFDGEKCVGYIPVDFTVDVLSEDFVYSSWTIQTVDACSVYSDEECTQKVTSLTSDATIRYFSSKNGIAKIAYKDADGWKIGYISQKTIQDKPNTSIRNVLIILAVTACMCGSVTFFLLRKKEN